MWFKYPNHGACHIFTGKTVLNTQRSSGYGTCSVGNNSMVRQSEALSFLIHLNIMPKI
jgi:hypothetical protein